MKLKRRYKLTLWIVLFAIVNICVYFYDYRTSSTEREVYELDEASIEFLKELNAPTIITFYKSKNLNLLEQRFADNVLRTLEAYQRTSKNPIHIEVVNPYESLDIELEATNSGIKSIEIKGQNNGLRKIFLGLIIQIGNRTEVLPQIMPQMSPEYLISSSFRKLTERRRRRIAVLQGHGEAHLSYMSGVEKRLLPNYDLDSVVLSPSVNLSEYESVLIVAPSLKYSDSELDQLDDFLNKGKNILIALDRVEYDIDEEEGYKIDTRLEEWLVHKGLIIQSDFIIDNSCSNVRIDDLALPIAFPYFPQITDFPKHISTAGVGVIALRFASSIEPTNRVGVCFKPLAKTSDVSGKKSLPLRINMKHEWTKGDYLFPKQTVAALLEGKLGAEKGKNARIVVISDGDVMLGNDRQRELDNHLFVANIIDWLSDSSGLAELKQKGINDDKRESEIEVSALKKYLNLFLPLLVVICVALFLHYRRKWHIDKLRMTDF